MGKIARLENLNKHFDGLRAVKEVDMTIERGSVTGLVGPNGAGKTTLFNLISGFLPPSTGSIYFEGREITDWSVSRRVKAGITRTFQGSRVFSGLSVRENVVTGTYSAKNREASEEPVGDGIGSRIDWILKVTKLRKYEEFLARHLSYGYKRRLELAIAIATNPKLLLLDEPFSGTNTFDLQELTGLIKLLSHKGLTVVLVEHDLGSVASLADNLVHMDGGKVTIPNE
ncbi:ATP-binding cassette domain-containing protein [Candidatus Bipolaricaulota bacterium]|nr:ATP-binding cassette domain-containing protein [Candidatus Bipolaricaulota bacterium]